MVFLGEPEDAVRDAAFFGDPFNEADCARTIKETMLSYRFKLTIVRINTKKLIKKFQHYFPGLITCCI